MWYSKQIRTVVQSSCEAEYIIAAHAGNEIKAINQLITELGLQIQRPVTLKIDNQSTIAVAKAPHKRSKLKHVDVKYMKLKEYIQYGLIRVEYIPAGEQTSDLGTKNLQKTLHSRHTQGAGLTQPEQ